MCERNAEPIVRAWIAWSAAVLIALTSPPTLAQHARGMRGLGPLAPRRVAPPPPQQTSARELTSQSREARDARMTPEERKQLRQDVSDHGREIYRDRGARNLR